MRDQLSRIFFFFFWPSPYLLTVFHLNCLWLFNCPDHLTALTVWLPWPFNCPDLPLAFDRPTFVRLSFFYFLTIIGLSQAWYSHIYSLFLSFFPSLKLDNHRKHKTRSTGPAELVVLPETQRNKTVNCSTCPQLPSNPTMPSLIDLSVSTDTSMSSFSTTYSTYTVFMAHTANNSTAMASVKGHDGNKIVPVLSKKKESKGII